MARVFLDMHDERHAAFVFTCYNRPGIEHPLRLAQIAPGNAQIDAVVNDSDIERLELVERPNLWSDRLALQAVAQGGRQHGRISFERRDTQRPIFSSGEHEISMREILSSRNMF